MNRLDKKILKKGRRKKRPKTLFSDAVLAHLLKQTSDCCLLLELQKKPFSFSQKISQNSPKANFKIDQALCSSMSDANGLVFQQTYENTTKAIHVYPNGIWQDTFFPMAGS